MTRAAIKRDTIKGRNIRRELSARNVAEGLGNISPGCEIYGLTKGQWSLIDLIEYCLDTTGPADVTVATWTAGGNDVRFAHQLFKSGHIKSIRFILDYSFASCSPEYCEQMRAAFGDDAIRLTSTHAKFVVINNSKWSLVLRGSANLNENRRLEWFEISDSPKMADFLLGVVGEIFHTQGETFEKRPYDLKQEFLTLWDSSTPTDGNIAAAEYFGDGPLDNDLRRTGVTYD